MKHTLRCVACGFARIVVRDIQPCLKCGGLTFYAEAGSLTASFLYGPTDVDRRFLRSIRITWDQLLGTDGRP